MPTIRFWLFLLLPLLACQLDTAVPLLSPMPPATAVPTLVATMPAPPAIPTPPPTAAPLILPPVEAGAATMPALRVGEMLAGQVRAGNAQVWQIRTTAGNDFVVWVQAQGGAEVVVQLRNERGEGGMSLSTADSTGTWALFTASEAVYTLSVAGQAGSTGDFRLVVLDWQRSAALAVEAAVAEDEVASYRLPFAAGQTLLFWLEPVGEWDGVLELYAPAGFILARDESSAGGTEEAIATAEVTGEYLIRVFGYLGQEGAFALRVFAVD